MTREEQLQFCRVCKNKKMDLHKGIVCALTNEKPAFNNECEHYNEDADAVIKLGDKKKWEESRVRMAKETADSVVNRLFIWIGIFVLCMATAGLSVLCGPLAIAIVLGVLLVAAFIYYIIKNKNSSANTGYVDLSLPSGTLWATCNLGASKPSESGDFVLFSSASEMPNIEQFEELMMPENCSWEWVVADGMQGYIVRSKRNSNSIFLPYIPSTITMQDSKDTFGFCAYWSSSKLEDKVDTEYFVLNLTSEKDIDTVDKEQAFNNINFDIKSNNVSVKFANAFMGIGSQERTDMAFVRPIKR